jgi:hypothetical protein
LIGIPYEWQLMALAVALYLSDCSLLLYSNEGVLIQSGTRGWRALFGGGAIIAGRSLHVLNPFTPHRAAFRLSWNQEAALSPRGDPAWSDLPAALAGIAPLVAAAAAGLFVLLPLGMFTDAGAWAVIGGLVLTYGGILAALLVLYRRRGRLPLRGKAFAGFAFECMACPPFGINLLRRLALRAPVEEPLPLAAHRLLTPERWLDCRERLAASLRSLAVDDQVRRQLLEQRERELPARAGR